MRQPQSPLTPAVVRRTAQAVLQQALPGKPYGRLVTVAQGRAAAAARQARPW